MLRLAGVAFAAAALAAGAGLAARAQTPAEGAGAAEAGNGAMSLFTGAGGDPARGAALYAQRCAGCHDNPDGRTPAKAALGGHTPTAIANALVDGVMRPMAQGLSPDDIASLATYLSTRGDGGLAETVAEAPACAGRPAPIRLDGDGWNGWGVTARQARFQPRPGLAAADVPRLKLKWAFAYPGSRNGQATVVGDRLFLTSSAGAVYALDASSGCARWRFDLPGGSRTSPVVGALPGPGGRHAVYVTGWVERTAYALDADTGRVIWKTRVDDQREVQMTGTPALQGGRLYVPVSSAEEAIATDDAYECCKFQGAVVAVDAATGKVLWRTAMAPGPAKPFRKNPKGTQMYGPAGAAIWSAPTIDVKRGVLYVATGDSYTDVELPTSDAIVALDLKTGAIRWTRQLTRDDNYIIGCYGRNRRANCPQTVGPDHDFGASPILHTLKNGRDLILAGQKSSQVYALDPDAQGKVVWERRLSEGGALGGVEFGMAADTDSLYAPISDVFTAGTPAAGVHAFRIADGTPLWSQILPRETCAWKTPYCSPAVSQAISAMPGVVFAGSMDGRFRALDAASGKVIWAYDTAAAPVATVSGRTAKGGVMDGAGPTIAGGTVYVNTGYQARSGTPGTVLMAFTVDGR